MLVATIIALDTALAEWAVSMSLLKSVDFFFIQEVEVEVELLLCKHDQLLNRVLRSQNLRMLWFLAI